MPSFKFKTSENMSSFKKLGLSKALLSGLSDIGYETPSPVQIEAIPALLDGRDLLGQAQTGTGKTAAFALPILSNIDLEHRAPQALVLTPTRELAIQVAESFQKYAKHLTHFQVMPLYGGQDMRHQLRMLKSGIHVIVGTPGRIMDHLERKSLDLSNLKTLVLDEADEMLKMGFIDDVEWILKHIPGEHQTALFSATMPHSIKNIANTYLKNPVQVKIKVENKSNLAIKKHFTVTTRPKKLDTLLSFLEIEDTDGVIIFTRTKTSTCEVADKLASRGFRAAAINGDLRQEAREQVIRRLKNNDLDIVVATDVAARGLDVERINYVINYDIPYDVESYVHRIGRTGRAGREGISLLFVEPKEKRLLRTFERGIQENLTEVFPPSQKQLAKKRLQVLAKKIQSVITTCDIARQKATIERLNSELELDTLDIAAALLYLEEQATQSSDDAVGEATNTNHSKAGGAYEISIGSKHAVKAKDIVGALTNEAGIAYGQIGKISILKATSIIDLGSDVSQSQVDAIGKLFIKNNPVKVRKMN